MFSAVAALRARLSMPHGLLAARGESLAAFDERCIPKPPQRGCRVGGPGAGGVAPPSNTPGILSRRALPAARLARLGATPDFHHGLLCVLCVCVAVLFRVFRMFRMFRVFRVLRAFRDLR